MSKKVVNMPNGYAEFQSQRLVGIIPARAGSKRIPGKNVRELGGRPLLAWTIASAKDSGVLAEIIVSTDSPAIAEIARASGANVPFLRSPSLASDNSHVVGAILEYLDHSSPSSVDGIVLLQPTSPFRKATTIRAAAQQFAAGAGRSVVSVSPSEIRPHWLRTLDDEGCLQMPAWSTGNDQAYGTEIYKLNGVIYIATVSTLRERQSLYSEPTLGLVITDWIETLDIDTVSDWEMAEILVRNLSTRAQNTSPEQ